MASVSNLGNSTTNPATGSVTAGARIRAALEMVHGLGDVIRGTALGAIDTIEGRGVMKNHDIARIGREEMWAALERFQGHSPTPADNQGPAESEGAVIGDAIKRQGPENTERIRGDDSAPAVNQDGLSKFGDLPNYGTIAHSNQPQQPLKQVGVAEARRDNHGYDTTPAQTYAADTKTNTHHSENADEAQGAQNPGHAGDGIREIHPDSNLQAAAAAATDVKELL